MTKKELWFESISGSDFSVIQFDPMDPQSVDGYVQSVKTMLEMMWSQAAGTPSGNHGLFHKYHIEAVTLQGIRRKNSNYAFPLERTGRYYYNENFYASNDYMYMQTAAFNTL